MYILKTFNAYLFLECVDILTKSKADANIKNTKGWTPLAETVSYGNRNSSRFFLFSSSFHQ